MTEALFVYGTLAPGRANAHVLAPLKGTWRNGSVRGQLHAEGWGATLGFPGIVLDPQGPEVKGQVFTAPGLADFWPTLDAFEGEGYRRVPVEVWLEGGDTLTCWIYSLA